MQSILELFKLEVDYSSTSFWQNARLHRVTYTATQSTLELFKLEVDYSSTSFHQNYKIAQESLIKQLNQYWDYLSQKSIIHQLCLAKVPRLHRSHLYSNSINTGTISARSQLFIHFVSAKVQDCIGVTYTATQSTLNYFSKSAKLHSSCLYSNSINTGTIHQLCFSKSARLHRVTYTATQSTLELFKLEVYYSSTLFQQKCKIAQESLIQQLNQHWNYLSQKLIIHQLHFTKNYKIAQESLIQQLNQYWDYLSQKLIIHQLHFTKITRLHRSHLYSNSVNTGTI